MNLTFLVRHGETALNVDTPEYPGIQTRGWTGIGLTDRGKAQAHTAAQLLVGRGAVGIVASDLTRTLETARILADTLQLPMSIDRRLDTWDIGVLSGKDETPELKGLLAYYETAGAHEYIQGSTESFHDFLNRVDLVLRDYEERSQADGSLILVSHGLFFMSVNHVRSGRQADLEDEPDVPPPGSVMELWPDDPIGTILSATAKSVPPSWQALLDLADRLEPAFRQAFLDAVAALRSHLTREELEQLVRTGDIRALDSSGIWNRFEAELTPNLRAAVQDAVVRSAQQTADRLPDAVASQLDFNLGNPRVVDAVDTVVANAINEMQQVNRQGLVAALRRGLGDGTPTETLARRIRDYLGLTDRDVIAVENYLAGLGRSDLPGGKQADLAERYANRLLRQRATRIARTETMRAVNAGQHATWQDAKSHGLLRGDEKRKWLVTPDDRLCPRCEAVESQEVGIGEYFQTDVGPLLDPPLHPQCRCVATLVVS